MDDACLLADLAIVSDFSDVVDAPAQTMHAPTPAADNDLALEEAALIDSLARKVSVTAKADRYHLVRGGFIWGSHSSFWCFWLDNSTWTRMLSMINECQTWTCALTFVVCRSALCKQPSNALFVCERFIVHYTACFMTCYDTHATCLRAKVTVGFDDFGSKRLALHHNNHVTWFCEGGCACYGDNNSWKRDPCADCLMSIWLCMCAIVLSSWGLIDTCALRDIAGNNDDLTDGDLIMLRHALSMMLVPIMFLSCHVSQHTMCFTPCYRLDQHALCLLLNWSDQCLRAAAWALRDMCAIAALLA
eukprot:1240192-Amphidinium_carterae.1